MNIFIGENNLKDYVFLKSIIEKWGIERQQEIYFHWYKQLYYQLPKCLKNCDLVFLGKLNTCTGAVSYTHHRAHDTKYKIT